MRLPDSPYAPKAILAGRQLDPVWGESAGPLLETQYRGQPVRRLPPGLRAVWLSRAGRLAPELRACPRCGRISACAPARRPPRLASHPPRRRTSAAARARAVRAAGPVSPAPSSAVAFRIPSPRRRDRRLRPGAGRSHGSRPPRRTGDQGGLPRASGGQPGPSGRRVPRGHAQLGGARESGLARCAPSTSLAREPLSRAQVLVNVVGFTVEEYARRRRRSRRDRPASRASSSISPVPTLSAGGIEFGAGADCVQRIVALCRTRTRLPLSRSCRRCCRISRGMAVVARDAGADGDHAWSTPFRDCSTSRNGAQRLGNGNGGVSGPALLAIGVLAAARVVERTGGDARDRGRRSALRGGRSAVSEGRGGAGRHRYRRHWPTRGCRNGSCVTWSGAMAEVILALDLPAAPRRSDCSIASRRSAGSKWDRSLMTREGAPFVRGAHRPRSPGVPGPQVARHPQHRRGRGPGREGVRSFHGDGSRAGRTNDDGGGRGGWRGRAAPRRGDRAHFARLPGLRAAAGRRRWTWRTRRYGRRARLPQRGLPAWSARRPRSPRCAGCWREEALARGAGHPPRDRRHGRSGPGRHRQGGGARGATHLVVGRPVLHAADPADALRHLFEEAGCVIS